MLNHAAAELNVIEAPKSLAIRRPMNLLRGVDVCM